MHRWTTGFEPRYLVVRDERPTKSVTISTASKVLKVLLFRNDVSSIYMIYIKKENYVDKDKKTINSRKFWPNILCKSV